MNEDPKLILQNMYGSNLTDELPKNVIRTIDLCININ